MGSVLMLEEVISVISLEQKSLFDVPTALLSFVLIGCLLFSLALSLAMLVAQVRNERERIMREALADKARRLRYKQGDRECEPSDLAEKHWHTFLSHVWSTGQDQVPPQEFEGRFPLLMAADSSRLMASVRLWLADAYHQATSARCAAVGIAKPMAKPRLQLCQTLTGWLGSPPRARQR